MSTFKFIFSIIILFLIGSSFSWKEKKLRLLTYSRMVSDGQGGLTHDSPACMAAIRLVMNETNSRNDILPSYTLIPEIENEGNAGFLSNYGLFNFLNRAALSNGSSMAPITIGPNFACNTVGLTLKELGFTTFSRQCNGPYVVDRRNLYSTIHSAVMPAIFVTIAAAKAVAEIGHWKRVAIVTSASNPADYFVARQLYSLLTSQRIDVIHYSNEYEITLSTVTALMNSSARVIALALTPGIDCSRFYCFTYQVGITGSLYAFVDTEGCSSIQTDSPTWGRYLPAGCTKEMYIAQMAITVASSMFLNPYKSFGNTSLGFDLQEFEEKFRRSVNGVISSDQATRHICFDAALGAVVALNKSDLILQTKYNLSLDDFQLQSKRIGKIVDDVVTALEIQGIRIGKLSYSADATVEDMAVSQTFGGKSRLLYRIVRHPNASNRSIYDLGTYALVKIVEPIWLTKSGSPPKDLSEVMQIETDQCSAAVLWVDFALTLVISVIQIGFLRTSRKQRSSQYFTIIYKSLLISACLLLNVGAVIILFGSLHFPAMECLLRPIFPMLGLTGIGAIVLTQLIVYSKLMNLKSKRPDLSNNISTIKSRFPSSVSTASSVTVVTAHRGKFIPLGFAILSAWNVGILIAWETTAPYKLMAETSLIQFSEEYDSYFNTTTSYCFSENVRYFLGVSLASQTCPLLLGVYHVYLISKLVIPRDFKIECKRLQVAVINCLVLLLAITVILLILGSSQKPCIQTCVLSFGLLLYSSSTAFIIFLRNERD